MAQSMNFFNCLPRFRPQDWDYGLGIVPETSIDCLNCGRFLGPLPPHSASLGTKVGSFTNLSYFLIKQDEMFCLLGPGMTIPYSKKELGQCGNTNATAQEAAGSTPLIGAKQDCTRGIRPVWTSVGSRLYFSSSERIMVTIKSGAWSMALSSICERWTNWRFGWTMSRSLKKSVRSAATSNVLSARRQPPSFTKPTKIPW